MGSLQYLSGRVQDGAPGRRAEEVQALQDKVSQLRLQALEHGCKMEDTLQVTATETTAVVHGCSTFCAYNVFKEVLVFCGLLNCVAVIGQCFCPQMWALWEQDSSWLDGLLSDTETSAPKMHLAQDSEEDLSNRIHLYQVIYLHTRIPASTLFKIKLYSYSMFHFELLRLHSNSKCITKRTIQPEQLITLTKKSDSQRIKQRKLHFKGLEESPCVYLWVSLCIFVCSINEGVLWLCAETEWSAGGQQAEAGAAVGGGALAAGGGL